MVSLSAAVPVQPLSIPTVLSLNSLTSCMLLLPRFLWNCRTEAALKCPLGWTVNSEDHVYLLRFRALPGVSSQPRASDCRSPSQGAGCFISVHLNQRAEGQHYHPWLQSIIIDVG